MVVQLVFAKQFGLFRTDEIEVRIRKSIVNVIRVKIVGDAPFLKTVNVGAATFVTVLNCGKRLSNQ
ncbi:hypothetical protein JCM10914_1026 [Paenibacillus sp. JCM 10914]|nr:hypothetical protein JCM10914_1026 [Paenibacillus sp. JCM 10914]